MQPLLLLLLQPALLLLLLLFTADTQPTSDTPPSSDTEDLPGCRPGQYLDPISGACRRCTDGKDFVDENYNRQPQCHACSTCQGKKRLATPCTATADTICRCPDGYHDTVEGMCRPADPSRVVTRATSAAPSTATTSGVGETRSGEEAKENFVPQANCSNGQDLLLYVGLAFHTITLALVLVIVIVMWRTHRGPQGGGGPRQADDGTTSPPRVNCSQQMKQRNPSETSPVKPPETTFPTSPDGQELREMAKSAGRTTAEHHRDHVPEASEAETLLTLDENAKGHTPQDQANGKRVMKRSLSRTAGAAAGHHESS